MAGKKQYFDHRYLFMRGLLAHEKMTRGKHYLKSAAECTSKAIVSLELSEKNVNTAKQAVKLEAIGVETVQRLEGYVASKAYSSDPPAPGRFVSSAGALLVALLNLVEKDKPPDQGDDGVALIAEDDLRTQAAQMCDEQFLAKDAPGFCQAWWRMEVLIKRDLIKRRSLNKENVYQLLPAGREAAIRLRLRSLGTQVPVRSSPKAPRKRKAAEDDHTPSRRRKMTSDSERASSTSKSPSGRPSAPASPSSAALATSVSCNSHVTDAMYSNDTGRDGIVLLVDIQECGGERRGLGELCEMIEQTGMVYKTRKLRVGDYAWVWRVDRQERPLPVLLERKRADDVAFSLKDGRFWGQINKMVAWKKEFSDKGVPAHLQYVIEGRPENFIAQCFDGCQGIGKCGNPTLQQVKRVLQDLDQHPELQVLKMESILDTVRHLHKTTSDLKMRADKGEFDPLVVAELKTDQEPKTVHVIDHDDFDRVQKTERSVTGATMEQVRDCKRENHEHACMKDMSTLPTATTVREHDSDEYAGHTTKPAEIRQDCGIRSSNCISLLDDDVQGLPPLDLPSPRRRARPWQNTSVVYTPDTKPSVELAGNRKVNTSSPRGRVYLMKRNFAKPATSPCKPPPSPTVGSGGELNNNNNCNYTQCSSDRSSSVADSECSRTQGASAVSPPNGLFKDKTSLFVGRDGKQTLQSSSKESDMCPLRLPHSQSDDDRASEASEGVELEVPGVKCSSSMGNSIRGQGGRAEAWDPNRSDSDSLPDLDLPGLVGESRLAGSRASVPSPPFSPTLHAEWGQIGGLTCDRSGQEAERKCAVRLPTELSESDAQPADKIAQIAAVFPQMSACDIAVVLQRCGGCVERCVIAVLEDPTLLSDTTPTTTTTTTTNASATTTTPTSSSTAHFIDLT